jgi:protein-lysine N-methyltransferase EEF2KMT
MEKMARFSTTKDPPELDAAQTMSTLTYSLPYDTQESLAHCVLIRESPNLLAAAGTTGLRTWDACLHLATYLATTTEGRSLVSGKSVLELGAGTGLLSLICAGPLSAAHVLATDADPNVDETITRNLNLNHHHHLCKTSGRQISLESRVLEWGGSGGGSSPADLARALLPSKGGSGSGSGSVLYPYYYYNTILGADITYSPDSLQALASTIDTLAESCPTPADIVISATIRNEETFDLFLGLCLEHGLSVYDVDFGCPELKLQKGLFHPLHPPIRIVRIKKER